MMLSTYNISVSLSANATVDAVALAGSTAGFNHSDFVLNEHNPAEKAAESVLQEMERRNNIFYAFSRYISSFFYGEPEKKAKVKPSKKRKLMSTGIAKTKFGPIPCQGDVTQDSNTKNAIHFVSTEDHNGAYAPTDPNVQRSKDNIINSGYNYYERHISGASQICDTLTTEFNKTKFNAMIISGHGYKYQVNLGPVGVQEDALLTARNIEQNLHCLPKHLHPHAKLIYQSCSTASLSELPVAWTFKIEGMERFSSQLNELYEFARAAFQSDSHRHKRNLAFQTYHVLSQHLPHVEVAGLRVPAGSRIENIDSLDTYSFVDPFFRDANFFVVYNQESAGYIYKGWEIQKKIHWVSQILPFSIFNFSPDQIAFEENQDALLKAMHYHPIHTYHDIYVLYKDRLERDWEYLAIPFWSALFALAGTIIFEKRDRVVDGGLGLSNVLLKQFDRARVTSRAANKAALLRLENNSTSSMFLRTNGL